MSILITGGRIITAADDYVGDIFVDGEHIALIGESLDVEADRVIDAERASTSCPAASTSTRTWTPSSAARPRPTTTTRARSRARSAGRRRSSTSPSSSPGETFTEGLGDWHEKIETNKPVIDVGFHLIVTDLKSGGSLADLAKLPDEGVTSYKLFMAYKGAVPWSTTRRCSRAMQVAAENGCRRDGARRERRRDRRARQGGARRGQHRAEVPLADAAAGDSRARRRTARSSSPTSPAARVYIVHVSCDGRDRADRAGAREGLGRLAARPARST